MQQDDREAGAKAPPQQQPPDDFARQLRDALMHLNDPARLLRHPLNAHLGPLLPDASPTADALRALLLDSIEALEPPDGLPTAGQNWRPYLALVYRYADGFTMADVARRLHVSPRQFRRELRMGLDALAFHLWGHLCDATASSPPPSRQIQAADSVLSEVKTLGLSLDLVAMSEVLGSIRPTAAFLSAHHGVTFEMPETEAKPVCVCDRTLTRQALISCLGAILGCASPRHADARLRVSAGSPGEAPAIVMTIEPPVSRADTSRLRAELAECEALLSTQGTTLALCHSADGSCEGVAIRFAARRGVSVLAVDDNEGMQQLYRRYLDGEGYLLSLAASAAEATRVLDRAIPEVIVLDVMMRDMDGWEFLQSLRARPDLRDTPVVICSVLREPGLAKALGAQAYLKKPITAEQLRQALSDVLG